MNFLARRVTAPVETPGNLIKAWPQRKWPISYDSIEPLAIAADVAGIFLSSVLAGVTYQLENLGTSGLVPQYIASAATVSALFIPLMIGRDQYDPAKLLDISGQIRSIAVVWTGVFLLCAAVVFALKVGADFSRRSMFLFAFAGLGILLLQRIFWYSILRRGLARHRFSGRNCLLIRDGSSGSGLVATLRKYGYELKQQFVLAADGPDTTVEEDISQIVSYLREWPEVEEVLVSAELDHCSKLLKRLAPLRDLPIAVTYVPLGAGVKILTRPSRRLGEAMYIELQRHKAGFGRAGTVSASAAADLTAVANESTNTRPQFRWSSLPPSAEEFMRLAKLFLIVRKRIIVGWAIQLMGTALWVYGYFVTGHPSLIDWRDITPWWFADWLPNIEAEIGLALVLAGMVLIYWPKREDRKNVDGPP